jgi:hypothetical protein
MAREVFPMPADVKARADEKNRRIQHCIMLTTFFVLVLSGLTLSWPSSRLGMAFVTEAVRHWVHRIATVAVTLLGVYSGGYMVGTKERRQGLIDFFDISDVFRTYAFYLDLSQKKPEFRFGRNQRNCAGSRFLANRSGRAAPTQVVCSVRCSYNVADIARRSYQYRDSRVYVDVQGDRGGTDVRDD